MWSEPMEKITRYADCWNSETTTTPLQLSSASKNGIENYREIYIKKKTLKLVSLYNNP